MPGRTVIGNQFRRREFLALAGASPLLTAAEPGPLLETYYRTIYEGFLRNAKRTSSSFAVCDFAGGTKLPGALAISGKTYDSVSRMMPAIAAWQASGRGDRSTAEVLRAMFTNSFDPRHPDYWGPAPPDRSHQKQVEASIVAWSLWLLRDLLVPQLSSGERANIQAWLASCTQVPVRRSNWAWFTAVNQAVRLDLGRQWPEFSGDRTWMLEDLAFLEKLAAPGDDGWFTDSLETPIYDYYNFWVFASHYLYWRKITGTPHPLFEARLRAFLKRTPYFFGSNGAHVLYGRSLIYRWAVLTPLVLAYQQGLWPHSPGLLHAIVRRNLQYLWGLGAYDAETGKLRETLTPGGSSAVKESYIDNGHPYWGMQAFALLLVPRGDFFWTTPEELLPVERGSFDERFEGARMRLTGNSRTGEVRWYQGSAPAHYGDKYAKFGYSSHFPFGIAADDHRAAQDQALLFVDPAGNRVARRTKVTRCLLSGFGLTLDWSAEFDDMQFRVETSIRLEDGREIRQHKIYAPAKAVERGIEVREGTYALGIPEGETLVRERWGSALMIRTSLGTVAAKMKEPSVEFATGENIVHARSAVIRSRVVLEQQQTEITSVIFASPVPNASLPPAF